MRGRGRTNSNEDSRNVCYDEDELVQYKYLELREKVHQLKSGTGEEAQGERRRGTREGRQEGE